MLGYALVIIGAIFLLKNLGLLAMVNWDIVWPIVVIVVGVMMVYRKKVW